MTYKGNVYIGQEKLMILQPPLNEFSLKSSSSYYVNVDCAPIQPSSTCSKLTIEKLEQGVKYIQS